MTNNWYASKNVRQIAFLSVLLTFQIFILTKLVVYDKTLMEDSVNQYENKSDQLNKYDINNDGAIDNQDVEKLKELLSDKKNLTEAELDRYDLNRKNGFDTYDISVLRKYLNGEN